MEAEQKSVILCRLMMLFVLASLIYRLLIFALPLDYLNPPFFSYSLELSFRAFGYFGWADRIIGSQTGATIFSILLLLFALLGVIFPRHNELFVVFSILYLFYYFAYNTVILNHSHYMTMMVWIALPFWARRPGNRLLIIDWLRYYVCFVYVASFIYKITGGSLFYWNNGYNSVKLNQVRYMYYFPDTWMTHFLSFSLKFPALLNLGSIFVYLLEGFMIVGFFTKKLDNRLIWIPVIIHLSTYLFADVIFLEMFVVLPLFLSDQQLTKISRLVPVLSR